MRLLLSLVLLVCLVSCQRADDCFKSTGDVVSENRELADFTKIVLNDNVDLYLIADSNTSARVEAGKNLIENVKTEVNDGVLTISNETGCNWVRSLKNEYKVYLYVKHLKELDCRGSGDIIGQNWLSTDTLLIDLEETYSSIYLDVSATQIYVKNHTGPGDVTLRGSADYCYTYTTGTGFIYCSELETRETWALNGGTGDIYVNAQDSLRAEITYIGNVFYKGHPSKIDVVDTGDGELKALK